MNNTMLSYSGKVNLKFKIKDKVVSLCIHNAGTKNLFKSLANYLAGNSLLDNDTILIPCCVDIKKGGSPSFSDDDFETILKNEASIPITRVAINTSQNSDSFPVSYEFTITYNSLSEPFNDNYTYFICLCDKNKETLAYLSLEASEYSLFTEGVQIIATWELTIDNAVENTSTTE